MRNQSTHKHGKMNDFSCWSQDGVPKGVKRKVCQKHRYRKMARGILHSKSFLPNIYKTWSVFDQYLKTNLRSTPDIQSNGSYAHTIKIEECEWVKHEKVVVVLHGGFGSEMGRVGKLEGGLNHDCDMSRSRMRGRHSRHSTLQCPSSVWLSFNHICSPSLIWKKISILF